MILDKEGGGSTALAIVDYKTSTDDAGRRRDYALQLAVYTDAGRREGLDVRAAYVHDLKAADRQTVDVSPGAIVTYRDPRRGLCPRPQESGLPGPPRPSVPSDAT